MQIANIVSITVVVYVGFVALMEALIGFVQPQMDEGLRLTTTDAAGQPSERMLAGARFDGKLCIASNHWLRGWYRQALAELRVVVEVDGESAGYLAIPIEGEERARVSDGYQMGFVLRFICGFAPSKFLRLDPIGPPARGAPGRGAVADQAAGIHRYSRQQNQALTA